MTITVLLADDQSMIREGLRLIVDGQDDMVVVAEAADGTTALDLALRCRPDVAVLDIEMPAPNGLVVAETLLRDPLWPGRVIMLTTFGRDEYLFDAIRAGASGFLLKTSPPSLLPVAIRQVCAGETMLSGELTRRLIERFAAQVSPAGRGPTALAALTAREVEVLRLVAHARSNAEIAASLHLAESTVKTHIVHILEKLALRDRTQAAVIAYEFGLVRPGEG